MFLFPFWKSWKVHGTHNSIYSICNSDLHWVATWFWDITFALSYEVVNFKSNIQAYAQFCSICSNFLCCYRFILSNRSYDFGKRLKDSFFRETALWLLFFLPWVTKCTSQPMKILTKLCSDINIKSYFWRLISHATSVLYPNQVHVFIACVLITNFKSYYLLRKHNYFCTIVLAFWII